MADVGSTNKRQWNGILSAGVDNGYTSIVNLDITPVSYNNYGTKHRPTSFYYKKRGAIVNIRDNVIWNTNWKNRDITWVNYGNWGEIDNRYFLLSDGPLGRFICHSSIKNGRLYDESGGYLPPNPSYYPSNSSNSQKFYKTQFVRGVPRDLTDAGTYGPEVGFIPLNAYNGTVGIIKSNNSNIVFDNVQIGDWVYCTDLTGDQKQQARQVVAKKTGGDDISTHEYAILNAPWLNIGVPSIEDIIDQDKEINEAITQLQTATSAGNETDTTKRQTILDGLLSIRNSTVTGGATQEGTLQQFSIFPERGDIVVYVTDNGIRLIHAYHNARNSSQAIIQNYALYQTEIQDWEANIRVYDISEFQGRTHLLLSSGYVLSGGVDFNKFSFSVDNINNVGDDKISQVMFKNFLVQFGRESISVVLYNTNGQSFSYQLSNSIGIFSRYSFIKHQNSLYFLGEDRRLYSIDIQPEGGGYTLITNDQSKQIRGELSNIKVGDEVNMSSYGHRLYIFINNKFNDADESNSKTRILIHDSDYNRWLSWDYCCGILTGIQRSPEATQLNSRVDGFIFSGGIPKVIDKLSEKSRRNECGEGVKSYIELYIGENEDGQTQFNTLSFKQLEWVKILLGRGIYTDGSTKIVIDSLVNGYKQQYQHDKWQHIDWVDKNNFIRAGGTITEPSECAMESLADCSNVVRPCTGSSNSLGMDNCICYDDKAFELAEVYNVFLDTRHLKRSDLYRVRIFSNGGDEIVFGGLVAGLEIYPIEVHDTDNADLLNSGEECCTEGEFID